MQYNCKAKSQNDDNVVYIISKNDAINETAHYPIQFDVYIQSR